MTDDIREYSGVGDITGEETLSDALERDARRYSKAFREEEEARLR